MMELIQMLNAVLNTLENVETHGRKNLDSLLGCMQTVEKVRNALIEKGGEPDV